MEVKTYETKEISNNRPRGAMAIGTLGFSVPAKAADNSTDYTITIPATLTVAQSGWNATDGITAQVKSGDTFDASKKLTVTAESTNIWALKSGQITIGYNLATATGTYSSSATPASWEFSATELNANGGTKKDMGIIVEDYSNKPAGSYTDTVTFTAKVGDAVTIKTVTWDNPIQSFIGDISDGESKSKDGVTVKSLKGITDSHEGAFMGIDGGNSFQFSVASGNITKIEITTSRRSVDNGNGWSSNVWTGKANTVNFGQYFFPTKIVFTIEE